MVAASPETDAGSDCLLFGIIARPACSMRDIYGRFEGRWPCARRPSPRLWCKSLFLPHLMMPRDMPDEGGDRMLRDRYEPMNLFPLVSALSLTLDPVLTQLDRLLDDDTLFQAVQ